MLWTDWDLNAEPSKYEAGVLTLDSDIRSLHLK
jgi:hypothetical protein